MQGDRDTPFHPFCGLWFTSKHLRKDMAGRFFWIKQRHNPQLGTYYVGYGRITTKEALRMENGSLYGSNVMHKYTSEGEYMAKIESLKASGERVQ